MTTGEFLNVRLSDVEFQKLRSRFGPQVTEDYIERASRWLKNTRKKRPCHYAMILTWIRKDGTIEAHTPKSAPLITAAEQHDRAVCLLHVQQREGVLNCTLEQCLAAIERLDREKGKL